MKFHLCSSKELELSALLKSIQLNLNLYIYIYMNDRAATKMARVRTDSFCPVWSIVAPLLKKVMHDLSNLFTRDLRYSLFFFLMILFSVPVVCINTSESPSM